MKNSPINIGILAPVDAGKTTMAEAMLCRTGTLRSAGRVDHQDAFLDTEVLEKKRGITIYSKMARFSIRDLDVTLVDTPGHADFSAEMERVLQVIDYAVLIISGADGVRPQVRTLWRLLSDYGIPAFIFVNKMDQETADREKLNAQIRESLSSHCLDFTPYSSAVSLRVPRAGNPEDGAQGNRSLSGRSSGKRVPDSRALCEENLPAQEPVSFSDSDFAEELAVCDEELMDRYLGGAAVTVEDIASLISERKVFPCFYGSALRMTGIDEFLEAMHRLIRVPEYPEEFGARIYKISRDADGHRLSFMKITGGTLRVRQVLRGRKMLLDTEADEEENRDWEEKAEQIRLYSGRNYTAVQEAAAGTICAVTGLSETYCGEGLGISAGESAPILEPVLTYALELPEGTDVHYFYSRLQTLEEEIPELHLVREEQTGEITVQVMGEVQTEILKTVIHQRYGIDVGFGKGRIIYRETIASPVDGVGHFEPLRHYAEVRLRLEPLERGSGIEIETECSTDVLALNWQRQILSALENKRHRGVLTGSQLTDVRIILTGGRASLKHTSGGDFRQAACRAVRQALMKAQNVLLEPVLSFTIRLPRKNLGRAMTDIEKMSGTVAAPQTTEEEAVITGVAPASEMRGYQTVLTSYTGGEGSLSCTPGGYRPCHNSGDVIEKAGYDPDQDLRNPAGSVFCAHGSGFFVPWDEVENYMHTEADNENTPAETSGSILSDYLEPARRWHDREAEDKELMEIFQRAGGANRNPGKSWKKSSRARVSGKSTRVYTGEKPKEQYLLVDGYNIIYAWKELSEIAAVSLEDARTRLLDILSNYQGYRNMTLIVVFDAYRVKGGEENVFRYHNIYVVYTKERETADAYIQRTVHKIGREKDVTVATSDGAEQAIVFGSGARRMAAREFEEEVRNTYREISEKYLAGHPGARTCLFDHIGEDLKKMLEDLKKSSQGEEGKRE